MIKNTFTLATILLLSACGMTQAPPYEADKAPEHRENYSGAKGMAQYGKDQQYLAKKALSDQCEAARVDLAVAKNEGDQEEVDRQQEIISRTCV